jgi:hypothetical protein
LMCHLDQVQNSLQVYSQESAELSLSAIRQLENAPEYWVAIHYTIVQTCRCNPRYFIILMSNMLDQFYEPSIPLKHPG